MEEKDLSSLSEFAIALACAGGQVLQYYWGKIQSVSDKDITGDLVTEADKESERTILALLQREYPQHEVLAEESANLDEASQKLASSEFLWVIDPLDGTTNYSHHYPVVAVSVGLLYRGQPIVGAIYNPIQKELFQAAQGKGATLNGDPIQVSDTSSLATSLLATGFPYNRRTTQDNNYAEFCHLTHLTHGVRRGGAAALDLAYVAAGRLDGYWELGIKPWDIAAGIIIVKESGGVVTAYDGSPLDLFSGRILASNGRIHKALVEELQYQRHQCHQNKKQIPS